MPAHVSRIPTKPAIVDGGKQHKGAQHVARMMKRTSGISPTAEAAFKSNTKVPTPVTAVPQSSFVPSRRVSATPSTVPPPAIRTPSLVSGSSASTFDSPRSNGLRRKHSGAIDRYAAQKRAGSGTTDRERAAMHGLTGFSREESDNTVLGITIPMTSNFGERQASIDSEGRDIYSSDASRDLTPPVLNYASSATPSTRYSDSPFSPVPTPSSASSYSPSLVATSNSTRSPIQTRPVPQKTVTPKENTSRLGLFPVRESSRSTSSFRTTARVDQKLPYERQSTTRENINASVQANSVRSTFRNRLTKANPNASTEKQKVQMPPELAHLNIDNVQPDVLKPRAPARPSRSGTSTLAGMANQSSVVHSDLPHVYTTYHKRTPSQETPVSATSPTKSRFGFSSRTSSRTTSPRVDSAISPPPSARQFHRSQTPESSGEGTGPRRKDSPAVSNHQSPAKSPRFGFLSRRARPEVPKLVEKPMRRASKGPVAGTGHEGYGRFGFRGRSGSNTSSTGVRSPSADSNSSGATTPAASKRKSSTGSKDSSDLDDFLKERLQPVILRGSGSTMSSDPMGVSLEPVSSKSSSLDSHSQMQLLPSAMRNASNNSAEQRLSRAWNMSESSEDDVIRRRPNLATRRSLTRLSSGENKSPVRVPPPINTNLLKKGPAIDSYDAEPTAWPRTDSSLPLSEDGREGLWLKPLDVKPTSKPRKWNFLHRAATSSPAKGKQKAVEAAEDVGISIHSVHNRAVAHYAMSDHMNTLGLEEVERIVRDSTDFEEDSFSESEPLAKVVPYEGPLLSMMPSPPAAEYCRDTDFSQRPYDPRLKVSRKVSDATRSRPESSAAQAIMTPDISGRRTPEPDQSQFDSSEQTNGSPRQPRLSPIGRIPAVVSKRDRDRKLPDTSFSRPFARSQPRPFAKPPGSVYSQIREMASPIETISQPVSSTSTRSDGTIHDIRSNTQTTPSVTTDRTSFDMQTNSEFLAFPPRKDSDQSYSCSDSSSIPSWMTSLPPQKEDVWNEYNDFMDEVMPLRTPLRTPTTGSSLGAPFQYSSMLWDGNGTSWPIPSRAGLPPTHQLPPLPGQPTVPTILTVPQQISQFLRPSLSPITPDTISGLGNHISTFPPRQASLHHAQHMYTHHPKRSSLTSARASISSSRYSKASTHSRSASLPDARNSQYEATPMPQAPSLVDIAEYPERRVKCSTNLRVGALMTSKWLSFGRVLFSPAHNEMHLADKPRVLVVDGLSSDWSHFVAMSYPSAEVYSLTCSNVDSSFVGKVPSNHRQIRLSSILASFPFPKGFFNSVVFRFPTATTEQAYTACLSECKRVLRPGGYLEMTVLDLDLMNMGPKARKAVRGLKTRMQQRDQEVCLKNLSDILVRLIGRRGFEGVQRCIVGVPTAGKIPQSQDMSSVSSDSSGLSPSNSTTKRLSLADLLENTDFAPAMNGNDEVITKMVARVGRWWYSSCYERALLPADRSIWKDKNLLRECEHHATKFRLLICHAQKPLQTRRRTVSV